MCLSGIAGWSKDSDNKKQNVVFTERFPVPFSVLGGAWGLKWLLLGLITNLRIDNFL
jgi:hypothetical protein